MTHVLTPRNTYLSVVNVALILGKPFKNIEKEIELGLFPIPTYRDRDGEQQFYWKDVKPCLNVLISCLKA